jgi:hypothetical protein
VEKAVSAHRETRHTWRLFCNVGATWLPPGTIPVLLHTQQQTQKAMAGGEDGETTAGVKSLASNEARVVVSLCDGPRFEAQGPG